SSRRRHTRWPRDWSSDVCSSDLGRVFLKGARIRYAGAVVGLIGQVAVGVVSLRAGVIAGGAITAACGIFAIVSMPETGFRRRPRSEERRVGKECQALWGWQTGGQ